MYSVSVRDHIMIAHSFRGEVFGPAQRLHGATYVVDVEFRRPELDADGIVVDIGRATEVLQTTLAGAQLPQPRRRAGVRRAQHDDRVPGARDLRSDRRGDRPRRCSAQRRAGVESVRVTLHESHVAWAAYPNATDVDAEHRTTDPRCARSPQFVVLVPGDLDTRTGGYGYDRRIIAGLRALGWTRRRAALDDSFPLPTAAARDARGRCACGRFRTARGRSIDGLALGAMPEEVERERAARCSRRARAPSARGRDRARSGHRRRAREQRAAGAGGRRAPWSSPAAATADALARYGVAADRIAVVEPGTDPRRSPGAARPRAVGHRPSASAGASATRSAVCCAWRR